MANLLKTISSLNILEDDKDYICSTLEKIFDAVSDRVDWLEDREPESDGEVYDSWSDKYDEMSELRDNIDEIVSDFQNYMDDEDLDSDESTDMLEDIANNT